MFERTRGFESHSPRYTPIWISPNESRINARRKVISMDERDEFLSDLKQAVLDSLEASFENWFELFVE
ncbi:MAG TPA: hypothetical protein VK553_11590 [Candidatus Nitrosopolaris rasttigaisensis]|nr:hypothetical protein [Candidatus Nitrosopolaris rasttigaisensis]